MIERASEDDVMALVSDRHDPPMQVGAVLLLDGGNHLDASRLTEAVKHRLISVPRLRQRLIDVPIGCGRLLDLVSVMTADGPDIARSAAGRLASEIALIPTAFFGATWTAGCTDTAVATWGAGEEQQRVELTSARPASCSRS